MSEVRPQDILGGRNRRPANDRHLNDETEVDMLDIRLPKSSGLNEGVRMLPFVFDKHTLTSVNFLYVA